MKKGASGNHRKREKHCDEPLPHVPKCAITQAVARLRFTGEQSTVSVPTNRIKPTGIIPFTSLVGCIPSSSIQMVNGAFQIQECGWYEVHFDVVVVETPNIPTGDPNRLSAAVQLAIIMPNGCASGCGCPALTVPETSFGTTVLPESTQQIFTDQVSEGTGTGRQTIHGNYLVHIQYPCSGLAVFNASQNESGAPIELRVASTSFSGVPPLNWSAYISIVKVQSC